MSLRGAPFGGDEAIPFFTIKAKYYTVCDCFVETVLSARKGFAMTPHPYNWLVLKSRVPTRVVITPKSARAARLIQRGKAAVFTRQ